MNRIDLTDVTFLIPLRLDSVERIENLEKTVDFILQNFDTQIHILEAARYSNNILSRIMPETIQIDFVKDFDPIFHRTRYINILTRKIDTPYCAIWDTDIIIPTEQIEESVKILREEKAEIVYPYSDLFLDVPRIIKEHYFETGEERILTQNMNKMKKMYQPTPLGGAFFAKRSSYMESGMENENYYGWGREDGDRFNRWQTLGYKIHRIQGALFHLTHERGSNSKFHDKMQNDIKTAEIVRIGSMSKEELEREIEKWE